MIPGIIIASLALICFVGAFVLMELQWKKNLPTEYYRGVGIKYVQGATKIDGVKKAIDCLYAKLTSKYNGTFAQNFIEKLWIEIVGENGSRQTFSCIVSQKTGIVGSIDFTRKYFFTKKYSIAVILQLPEYKTLNSSSFYHEVAEHLLPYELGIGYNEGHSIKEYSDFESDLHLAFNQKKD